MSLITASRWDEETDSLALDRHVHAHDLAGGVYCRPPAHAWIDRRGEMNLLIKGVLHQAVIGPLYNAQADVLREIPSNRGAYPAAALWRRS